MLNYDCAFADKGLAKTVCVDNITWKLKNRKHGRPENQASFLAVKVFFPVWTSSCWLIAMAMLIGGCSFNHGHVHVVEMDDTYHNYQYYRYRCLQYRYLVPCNSDMILSSRDVLCVYLEHAENLCHQRDCFPRLVPT